MVTIIVVNGLMDRNREEVYKSIINKAFDIKDNGRLTYLMDTGKSSMMMDLHMSESLKIIRNMARESFLMFKMSKSFNKSMIMA